MFEKTFVKCEHCGKEIDVTNSMRNFDYHLAIHYNPMSRNCSKWYKSFFKKDRNVCVCKICDQEFFHDKTEGLGAGLQYENHLLKSHGISKT